MCRHRQMVTWLTVIPLIDGSWKQAEVFNKIWHGTQYSSAAGASNPPSPSDSEDSEAILSIKENGFEREVKMGAKLMGSIATHRQPLIARERMLQREPERGSVETYCKEA